MKNNRNYCSICCICLLLCFATAVLSGCFAVEAEGTSLQEASAEAAADSESAADGDAANDAAGAEVPIGEPWEPEWDALKGWPVYDWSCEPEVIATSAMVIPWAENRLHDVSYGCWLVGMECLFHVRFGVCSPELSALLDGAGVPYEVVEYTPDALDCEPEPVLCYHANLSYPDMTALWRLMQEAGFATKCEICRCGESGAGADMVTELPDPLPRSVDSAILTGYLTPEEAIERGLLTPEEAVKRGFLTAD